MVALLVLFTIVACLVVDGILMSVRERHAVVSGKAVPVPMENMVFAQDGGEPRGPETEKDRNISWEEVESGGKEAE
ncbi:MAG: hypothetical protein DRJ14_08560 [Acidobacteria bacterium]|nr:MAG: hypothetical protein DRJ14_08560 [Acidobacteriota bacterium]